MNPEKPFSQACENNKQPILEKLREVFGAPGTILEIGTGTGQHAVHFAGHLPHLIWQPSDHPDQADLCRGWLAEAGLPNILSPVVLDVCFETWPIPDIDGVFSANTAHIMGWEEVKAMFRGVGMHLAAGGAFCLYGPFNYHSQYTSDSNRRFDNFLKSRASHMGIRDMDDLTDVAGQVGLALETDFSMPANNRLLVWRRL